MPDFPRSLLEFQKRFPTDQACGEYLLALRWPNGFGCPACGHGRGWRLDRAVPTFECAACHRQTSVTAGPCCIARTCRSPPGSGRRT